MKSWRSAAKRGGISPWGIALLLAVAACGSDRSSAPENTTAPDRIVTLTPSLTELVATLGSADRIVAVDRYSTYPPEVADLPKVGGFIDANFEPILSLRPDLVVLSDVQKKIVPPLQAAGIRAVVLRMHTIDDVRLGLTTLGAVLGAEKRARSVVEDIERSIEQASKRARARGGERPQVLVILDRDRELSKLVAAGPGTFIDELLAIIGAGNAIASSGLRYASISPEKILRARPTVILDIVMGRDPAKSHANWSRLPSVPAVAEGRVHTVGDALLTTPGPRLGEALQRLESIIYGIRAP